MSRHPWLRFTEEQMAEMERLYRHGWSTARIAAIHGCLPGSIHARLVRRGVPMRPRARTRRRAYLSSGGYVKWGNAYVHRIVAEAWRGTPLLAGETIHHRDGDKTNNHPDNLQICASHSEHMRFEKWRVQWTEERIVHLIALREAGMPAHAIAREVGTTAYAVNAAVQKLVASGRTPRLKARHHARDCHNRVEALKGRRIA